MSKAKRTKGGGWKPLKLEGAILEGVEGLVGIEELTDYNWQKGNRKPKKVIPKEIPEGKPESKKKQRQNLDSDSDGELEEPSPKKKKLDKLQKKGETRTKKKNEQKKNAKQLIPTEDESGIGSSNEVNSENEDDLKLNKNEADIIEDLQSGINLESWASLGVPSVIMRALADLKFEAPTPIQSLTLAPAILGRRDILGAAETGSGKTLAFGIPILNGIMELKAKQEEEVSENEDEDKDEDHVFDDDEEISVDDEEEKVEEEEEEEDEEEEEEVNEESVVEDESNEDIEHEDNDVLQSDSDKEAERSDGASVESDFEEREEILGDELLDEHGIGCVRAIDNIQIGRSRGSPTKPLYALILTPTRELALQVKNHLVKAAKYTGIRIAIVVGGMAAVKQERILSKGPEIVVATPGRLWELIQEGNPHLNQVDNIKYLAIDETDRMVERGHFQELHNLLEKINMDKSKLQNRQTFVFSATLTMVHDIPQHLMKKKSKHARSKILKLTPGQKLQKVIDMLGITDPKIVDVTKQSGTAGSLTECRIACTMDHKDYYLYYLLKRHAGRTLVFCNSIGCVRRLTTLLGILDCNPLPLHASMQQRQRFKSLERFQENENGLLIATDVAARGLDIPNVEHVIHYQVPRTSEGYVHRSGRTARAQKEGITILMMEPSEMQYYSRLCRTLGRTQDLPTFPVVDRLLVAVKERMNLAREIDKLELRCRRDNAQKGWLQKAVEDMDLVLDEDQVETTMETKESADVRRQLKAKRHQLKSLLSKPLFPKGFSGKYLDTDLHLQLDEGTQKAVEVMKQAIEDNPKKKNKSTIGIPKANNAFKRKKKFKKGKKGKK